MADEIVIKYAADISKLQTGLNTVEKDLLTIEKESKTSMNTLSKESNKAAGSVDKVDKQVGGLTNSLTNLSNKLPFAGAIQEIQEFGGGIKDTITNVNSASKSFGVLKIAINGALGVFGLILGAFASLVAYFKSTEEGGDKLAKILRVVSGVAEQFVKVIADIGSVVSELLPSMDSVKESTDDYTKSVTDLAIEIADLEDHIGALTIAIDLQNEKIQTAIENNLRKLRNQNIQYKESLKIIDQVGSLEEQKLANSNKLLDEKLELERKEFLLKTQDFGADKQRIEELQQAEARLAKQEQGFRRDIQLQIARDGLAEFKSIIEGNKKKGLLFDQFVKGQIDAEQLLDRAKGTFKEEDAKRIADLLKQREFAGRESSNLEERLQNFKDAAANRDKARRDKEKQDTDKAFQDKLKHINEAEKLALDSAKIEGASQEDIIRIQEQFNIKKIDLFQKYNRTNELSYKEYLLKVRELEISYSAFLVATENKRLEDIKKHRQLILAELDNSFKAENNLFRQATNEQLNTLASQYQKGAITKEQFEETSAQITINIQKQAIQDEIDLLNEKLNFVEAGSKEQIDIESKIIDDKQKLYDLDLNAFKVTEEKKKAEIAKRKALEKQAAIQAVDIIGQANAAIIDSKLNEENAKIELEKNALDQSNANQLKSLEARKEAGLISEEEFNKQKAKIDLKKSQDELKLKQKQFKADQDANVNKIKMDTAVAVVKTYTSYGGFTPAAAIAIFGLLASAGIQIAAIRNAQPPKFAEGGEIKGRKHSSGGVTIEAEGGEYITKASQTSKYKSALSAINNDYFDKYVNSNYVVPAMRKAEERERALKLRAANTSENLMNSLSLNGFGDMSHLERLTKSNKKVFVQNLEGLPKEIGNQVGRVLANKNYMK